MGEGDKTGDASADQDPTTLVCPKCNKELSSESPYCPNDHAVDGGVHAVTMGAIARTPRSKRDLLGVTIGDAYVINGYLGSGGFGAVYRAEQKALGRDVAIKLLMVDREVDESHVNRFKREARTAAQLLDPNIVTLFDYGETDLGEQEDTKVLYFVMELVHGPTLRQYLKARRERGAGLEGSLQFSLNILRGLSAAHQLGVVHRDLKPGNVLIDESKGRRHFARLFDFGISSLAGSGGHTTAIGAGGVIGTPKYMAPEQWRAQQTAPCTDVYAFGVMLAEMLSGQPPIPKAELVEMATSHCRNPRPTITQTPRGEAVPRAVTNFIKKCMAIDPRQRYSNAREALSVLQAIIEAGERAPIPTISHFPAPGTHDLTDPSLSLSLSNPPGQGAPPLAPPPPTPPGPASISASQPISGVHSISASQPIQPASITGSQSISGSFPSGSISAPQPTAGQPPPFQVATRPPDRLSAPIPAPGPPPVVATPTPPAPEPMVIREPARRWPLWVALGVLLFGIVGLIMVFSGPDPLDPNAGAGAGTPATTAPPTQPPTAPPTQPPTAPPSTAPASDAAPPDAAPQDAGPPDAAPVAAPTEPPKPIKKIVRRRTPPKVEKAVVTDAPKAPPTAAPTAPPSAVAKRRVGGIDVTPKANVTADDLAKAQRNYDRGVDAMKRGAPKSALRFLVKSLKGGLKGGQARDAQRRIKEIVDRATLEAQKF